MRLVSVQYGMPKTLGDPGSTLAMEKEWTTGFYKTPTDDPVNLTHLGIDGDGVADHKHHGGVDKAVLAYSSDRYGYWQEKLKPLMVSENPRFSERRHSGFGLTITEPMALATGDRATKSLPIAPEASAYGSGKTKDTTSETIGPGGFGENLTITGCDESSVCIGDQFEIGSVIVEVSQPREPCWKLGRRWQEKMLPKYVAQCGYTGWYFRVARPGRLQKGDSVTLVHRPNPSWTVQRANDALYDRIVDATVITELYLLPELSAAWKKSLG